MRFHYLTLIAVLGITVSADSGAGVVTIKGVTYTMTNLAKPTGKVSLGGNGDQPATSAGAGADQEAQSTGDSGSQPTPTSNRAGPTLAVGAINGVGALLLPLLL